MSWLSENWVWVLLGVAFIAMHFFGHGGHGGGCGHGGHGGHGSRGDGNVNSNNAAEAQGKGNPPGATGAGREAHRH